MDMNILGFLPVLLPVALSPGASFTLVMNGALAGGHHGLYRTLTGTALGIYTHALLIGLGITAVIVSSPAVFSALKIAGMAYLLWLGITLIRSGIKTQYDQLNTHGPSVTVKTAWLANLLNPKAIMFYLTVVSSFAGKNADIGNYLILASVHVAVMSLWLIGISHTLIFSAKKANPFMFKKIVNIAGGLILIIFSLHGFMQ